MGFLPGSRRAWVYLVCAVGVFLILDVLALAGSTFATGLLVTLGGFVVGVTGAVGLVYPFTKRLARSSPLRYLWFFGGVASLFLIVVVGSALAGIPLFPTAEGGFTSAFLYGLAFGFGSGAANFALGGGVRSAFLGVLADSPESSRVAARTLGVIAATIIGLLLLFLLGYVLLEFILTPIVRSLAS
ncbi:hypothetical protein [Rubrobacter indicoceani]|uniref:hypothetical protein n=1 Tax=Rubrobacter indicoceani TaxID=2051957 RepID=UPI000E5C365F|nr:hypothetical protein [Rubrobacter indicoceani]